MNKLMNQPDPMSGFFGHALLINKTLLQGILHRVSFVHPVITAAILDSNFVNSYIFE